MRALALAALLALAACQLQEPTLRGTVLSVEELERVEKVELDWRHYEHPLLPEVAWRVEVRLDDGSAVTLTHAGTRRYEPGERVRLLVGEQGELLL
jgi:hypothetical protein